MLVIGYNVSIRRTICYCVCSWMRVTRVLKTGLSNPSIISVITILLPTFQGGAADVVYSNCHCSSVVFASL